MLYASQFWWVIKLSNPTSYLELPWNKCLKAFLHYALFHRRFSFYLALFILPRVFPSVLDTNMLVSKTREKYNENARKIPKREPNSKNVSILYYALGKNASQSHFACVCSCFACILLAFCLRFAHKL